MGENGSGELGDGGEGFEETWENGKGLGDTGKTAPGKMGVSGENGFPGDRGVPGEDGEMEKAAQLCSREMLFWSSAGEEEVLRF